MTGDCLGSQGGFYPDYGYNKQRHTSAPLRPYQEAHGGPDTVYHRIKCHEGSRLDKPQLDMYIVIWWCMYSITR